MHPFGDPTPGTGGEAAKGIGTLLQGAEMRGDAKEVLVAKCADCHSNETRWPAYARLAPGSWLIERDVVEGRKHLNLSHWETLTPDDRQVLEAKIVQEAKSGDMPPPQYLALHWGSKLTKNDVRALSELGKGTVRSEATAGGTGDPVRGKMLFEKRCAGCHALEANREGPRLAGIFGRAAGSVPGFGYSRALKRSGVTWNAESLERWLSDPDALVKDNNMDFMVAKADERRDIIMYLEQSAR
jgi:cytochrome c